jgi:WD40 repeat protein
MWQKEQGWISTTSYDLLRNTARIDEVTAEKMEPFVLSRTVKYTKDMIVECIQFIPDGQSIVVGTADGWIEIWDMKGQLREEDEVKPMSMESSVICLGLNPKGTILATGSILGSVSVWDLHTHQCLRYFKGSSSSSSSRKDTESITSVSFYKDDDSQILCSSLNGCLR